MLTRRPHPPSSELLLVTVVATLAAWTASCTDNPEGGAPHPQSARDSESAVAAHVDDDGGQAFGRQRAAMVAEQLVARDITSRQVLDAMGRVPRHEFVLASLRPLAYIDSPLPIGHEQTISQPYIVALMTQLAN